MISFQSLERRDFLRAGMALAGLGVLSSCKALELAAAERVNGLFLIDNPVLVSSASRVGGLARRHRLPMSSANRPLAAAGGLLAHGVDRPALYRRAAGYVDRNEGLWACSLSQSLWFQIMTQGRGYRHHCWQHSET